MAVIWVDCSWFWFFFLLFAVDGENESLIDELFFFDGWRTKKINIKIIISNPQRRRFCVFLRFEKKDIFDISQPNCEFRQEKARNFTMYPPLMTLYSVLGRQQTLLIKAGCDRRNQITIRQPVLTAKYTPKNYKCGCIALISITTFSLSGSLFMFHLICHSRVSHQSHSIQFVIYFLSAEPNAFRPAWSMRNTRGTQWKDLLASFIACPSVMTRSHEKMST